MALVVKHKKTMRVFFSAPKKIQLSTIFLSQVKKLSLFLEVIKIKHLKKIIHAPPSPGKCIRYFSPYTKKEKTTCFDKNTHFFQSFHHILNSTLLLGHSALGHIDIVVDFLNLFTLFHCLRTNQQCLLLQAI